jgi:hypothetical protein
MRIIIESKTYRQPLRVIGTRLGEQGVQRVVSWQDEADGVDEKLGTDVEKDEEEVQGGEAEDDVNLGDTSLLLKLIHVLVFSELSEALADRSEASVGMR